MKDVKVKFSLLDVIDLMESDIITSVHNDVTEIESSELSQFNNGGEDQFILHLKVPEPKSDLKREKFSREQIKHILAAVAADENGEIVDEIEGVGIVIDSKGNATVEYSAFETVKPVTDKQVEDWTDYLLGLRDTTQCDECPARKVYTESLAK